MHAACKVVDEHAKHGSFFCNGKCCTSKGQHLRRVLPYTGTASIIQAEGHNSLPKSNRPTISEEIENAFIINKLI